MEWAEDLPEQCPPAQAAPPDGDKFYRFISATPLKEEDFYSQRKLKPLQAFSNIDECIAHAVSLFNNVDTAKKKITKLPTQRGLKLVEITLPQNSGVILPTLSKNHISWWRVKDFLPATYTLVE